MHFTPYDVAFLALAPIAALASLSLKRNLHLAVIVVAVAIAGWGLAFASEAWVDAQEDARFDRIADPTTADIIRHDSDAATKSAIFIFGLPVSLVYTTVCFILLRRSRYLLRRGRDV